MFKRIVEDDGRFLLQKWSLFYFSWITFDKSDKTWYNSIYHNSYFETAAEAERSAKGPRIVGYL